MQFFSEQVAFYGIIMSCNLSTRCMRDINNPSSHSTFRDTLSRVTRTKSDRIEEQEKLDEKRKEERLRLSLCVKALAKNVCDSSFHFPVLENVNVFEGGEE